MWQRLIIFELVVGSSAMQLKNMKLGLWFYYYKKDYIVISNGGETVSKKRSQKNLRKDKNLFWVLIEFFRFRAV